MTPCPNGWGGSVNVDALWCDHCRRPTKPEDIAESPMCIKPPGACWQWWGSLEHRMRCRKMKDHRGAHSTHNDCGERGGAYGRSSICGMEPDHEGPHGWERV